MDTNTGTPRISGFTLQLYVPTSALSDGRTFYSLLFGRGPDFAPHDDFLEWAVVVGQEGWVQLVASAEPEPLANRARFRVGELAEALAFLDEAGIDHSSPEVLPGVVAFVDFSDPWGNALGYYQDIQPSGAQREYVGTSVHDDSLFKRLG